MLLDKGIKNIQELKADFTPSRVSAEDIYSRFKALKLSECFSEFKYFKRCGYDFKMVLALLVSIVSGPDKTVNAYRKSIPGEDCEMGKDVFYRLKNNPGICWRMVLWHVALRFLKVTSTGEKGSPEDGKQKEEPSRYLIFDDTTLPKSGKRIEKIGKVWDHVTNRYILGFKLLVMMYWDGKSAIPLDFSLHREKGKKQDRPFGMTVKELRRQFSRKRVKESYTAKRAEELDTDKITMVLRMFYSAIYRKIRVNYVLVDSWFTCDLLIQAVRGVRDQAVHLIGMYKFPKTRFEYAGKSLTHAQINNMLGKPKRCRALGYHYKQARVTYKGVEICLFFTRRGSNDNWKVFLTTDTSLTFKKMVEHYQVRWVVEVFNREAKQLLNLGKCQSSNFDAQIAETTVSMMAYLLVTLRFRYDNYESKGALYRAMNGEVLRETLDRRLWGLFLEMVCTVAEVLGVDALDLLERLLYNQQGGSMVSALWVEIRKNENSETG